MTDQTIELANLATKIIAILAFNEWNPTTSEDISAQIANVGIDLSDKEEIRTLCTRNGIETSDYGDDAPSVTFGHTPQLDQAIAEAAVRRLHDAAKSGDILGELKAHESLKAILAQAVGMRLK